MLDEDPAHRTERRGCGTPRPRVSCRRSSTGRATRSMRRRPASSPTGQKTQTETIARQAFDAGWPQGWRRLDRCPCRSVPSDSFRVDGERARSPAVRPRRYRRLAAARGKPAVDDAAAATAGARNPCPAIAARNARKARDRQLLAGEFFLEIAHGRIRRGGRVNIVVDADGAPLLVEKMNLGESHSAMAVAPVAICDVVLPPGACSHCVIRRYAAAARSRLRHALPCAAIEQARFLPDHAGRVARRAPARSARSSRPSSVATCSRRPPPPSSTCGTSRTSGWRAAEARRRCAFRPSSIRLRARGRSVAGAAGRPPPPSSNACAWST